MHFFFSSCVAPGELLQGYFYAEEGATYFHFAWNASKLSALLAPHQGYYSLYPNATMLLAARLLPVSFAAAFGAWCALAILLLMVYLIASCELFTTFEERLLGVCIALAASPSLTVSLSTINSQYHLAICAALVLVSSSTRLTILRAFTLLLGGLTGVLTCLFLPFFVLTAIQDRSRIRSIQAGVLLLCCLVQGAVVHHDSTVRASSIAPHHALKDVFSAMLLNSPTMEFGSRIPWHFTIAMIKHHPSALVSDSCALLGVAFVVLMLWVARGSVRATRWLIVMGLFSGFVSLMFAIGAERVYLEGTPRYLIVCNALIGLALLILIYNRQIRASRFSPPTLLIVMLFLSGSVDLASYGHITRCEPSWPAEIRLWESG